MGSQVQTLQRAPFLSNLLWLIRQERRMDTENIENKNSAPRRVIRYGLIWFVMVTCLAGCGGPSLFYHRHIDVSKSTAWWGELATNRVVRLKVDAMIYKGRISPNSVLIGPVNSNQEFVTLETYKSNPSRWPQVQLVERGTRMRCIELTRHLAITSSGYLVLAEILDGNSKGQRVGVSNLLNGDPSKQGKGSLRLVPGFLELAE
jgi:hypothetical protein